MLDYFSFNWCSNMVILEMDADLPGPFDLLELICLMLICFLLLQSIPMCYLIIQVWKLKCCDRQFGVDLRRRFLICMCIEHVYRVHVDLTRHVRTLQYLSFFSNILIFHCGESETELSKCTTYQLICHFQLSFLLTVWCVAFTA